MDTAGRDDIILQVYHDPMADRRRYHDDQIREIFDLAARKEESRVRSVSEERGLTLAELQDVALEVGMDPDHVAEAAADVEARRGRLPRRTSLGMPVAVGRVVELPAGLTDHEWDLLVTEFRETFGAEGQVSSRGAAREWTGGGVQASLEPTPAGARLQLTARKPGASLLNAAGVANGAVGLGLLVADAIAELIGHSVFTGNFLTGPGLLVPLLFMAICAAVLIPNLLVLPPWAREREKQVEHLADRAREMSEASSEADDLSVSQPGSRIS